MFLMVLDDGETYSLLDGCKIIEVESDLQEDPNLDEIVRLAYNFSVSPEIGRIAVQFKDLKMEFYRPKPSTLRLDVDVPDERFSSGDVNSLELYDEYS